MAGAVLLLGLIAYSLSGESEDAGAGGVFYTVTSNADPGDGNCFTNGCTLREAINLANGGQGNTIAFDLPGCPATPINCVIEVGSALPAVNQPFTVIDGTTQPGYAGQPIVNLSGDGAGAANGLVLSQGSTDVMGLVIENFQQSGIVTAGGTANINITDNAIFENGFDGIVLGSGFYFIARNILALNGQAGVDGEACPTNTFFTSNDFLANGLGHGGIQICGDDHEVHFNRFVGNGTAIDDIFDSGVPVDAENNWFGCNAGPGDPFCDNVADASIDADPWLVMNFGATPTTITEGGMSTLTAHFNMNSNGADTSLLGALRDSESAVNFQTDLGSLGSNSILKDTVDGVAVATLNADTGPGTAHVSATSGNETLMTEVMIEPAPTPTASPIPTASPTLTPSPTQTPGQLKGDYNCSGVIEIGDPLPLLTDIADVDALTPCVGVGVAGAPLVYGDVNCDQQVTVADVVALLQYVGGLSIEPALPSGCAAIGSEQ